MVTPAEGPHSAADRYVDLLGIELEAFDAGTATCAVTVRPELVNALGRSHGGLVFSLADAAIARASNRPGEPAVVTMSNIQILRGTYPGARLVAHATEDHRGGRLGAYRADITCDGRLVAIATAQSLRVDAAAAHPPDPSSSRPNPKETP